MITENILKRTPLFEEHLKLNARMVPFGGWEMPVQYDGILKEYEYTRKATAIFDICHMGEFILEDDYEKSGFDKIVTMPLKDLPVKQCRYGAMLNDDGGVIDDLIVFRLDEKKWFIVVNASRIETDFNHIKKNLVSNSLFKDVSSLTGKIDIQGPLSRDVLSKFANDITKLEYYNFDFFNLLGQKALISRTGYTGELGYEIFYPWDKIKDLWRELVKDPNIKPAGLGARDILRLEMGYSLYGHELNENISVLESGLEKFIDFSKDFIGKQAVFNQKQQGLKRKISGLISESRQSPRAEDDIFNEKGQIIGTVTSGSFSPAVQKGIGLGLIPKEFAVKGNKVFFGNEKNKKSCSVSGKIFYKNNSLKT